MTGSLTSAKTFTCAELIELSEAVDLLGSKVVEFDEAAANEWVEAHPLALRKGAQQLLKLTNFVDYGRFSKRIDDQTRKIIRDLKKKDRPIVVVASHEDDIHGRSEKIKSSHWLTGRALTKFKELRSLPMLTAHEKPRIEDALRNGCRQIIIIDDMSISGDQLISNLKAISQAGHWYTFQVTLIIPYSTNDARKRLRRYEALSDSITINWPGKANIVSTYDLFYTEEDVRIDEAYKIALKREKIIFSGGWDSSQGLTLFEHKLPDSESFPPWMVEGRVPGTNKRFPFIKAEKAAYSAL